jgi:hypothetical protein
MNLVRFVYKPKWEKKVAEQLSKKWNRKLLPLVIQIRQWSDRKKIRSTAF